MTMVLVEKDIIRNIFMKLSKWEGEPYEEKDPGEFVGLIFSETNVTLPTMNDVIANKPILAWKALHTGDLAVYSNGCSNLMGLVMGEIERQFCFADPKTSTVQIVDFDDNVIGYNYVNGFKVI